MFNVEKHLLTKSLSSFAALTQPPLAGGGLTLALAYLKYEEAF